MTLAGALTALGRGICRRPGWVLATTVGGALALAAAGVGLEERLTGSTAELPGSESAQVAEALRRDFARPVGGRLVVTAEGRAGVAEALAIARKALAAHPDVAHVTPFAGKALLVNLSAQTQRPGVLGPDPERATPHLRAALAPAREALRKSDPEGRLSLTGAGPLAYDLARFGAEDGARAEARVLPATLAILLLAFGALTAALVPLGLGLLATAAALGAIALATHALPLAAVVQNVATMLGLAVGIDYALLMIGRFREALARGLSPPDAVAETMGTAGVAVACSGATVMIGLAGLALTPSPNTRSIGVGGALVLACGVTLALTALPALLALLGPSIDAPRAFRTKLLAFGAADRWAAWAAAVRRRARPLAALGLLLLALGCAPLAWLRTDYGAASLLPRYDLEFQHGLDALARLGAKNAYAPVDLLVTAPAGRPLDPRHLTALLDLSMQLRRDPRVAQVYGPVDVDPKLPAAFYRLLWASPHGARSRAPELFDAYVSRDRTAVLFQVVAHDALRFEEIQVLARDLRQATVPPGLGIAVGGQAAQYVDTHDAVVASFPGMVAFVLAATFFAMATTYRSVLVPLKATLLNLLPVGCGMAALVPLFQWGWFPGLHEPTGGLPPAVLATIFGIVFGLSMDYEVFLISRIKEAYDATGDDAQAVETGLAATGGAITAAAAIMATVFAGFAGMELVMVQMLGVGLAVAVLVDATIVRIAVAPALMLLAGRWNWWPGGYKPSRRTPP